MTFKHDAMPPVATAVTRREAMRAGLLGAAGMAIGPASLLQGKLMESQEQENDRKAGWIDAHSHIWTRDVKEYPLAEGKTVDDLQPSSFTTEELLKTAGKEGVSRVVLIAHSQFYRFDNSYMTDSAKKHPGRFRVVGMIDDAKPNPDAAMQKLLKQKVTGFRITPALRGRDKWLKTDGMQTMWKTAARTRQAMCCLINPEDLADVDKMCAAHPETPVVVDHFGRVGVDGTIREADLKRLCNLAKHKQTHVKISAYYALGKKKPPYLDLVPMIRRVFEAFGPKRLMWASDSPYQLVGGNSYAASIALVRDKLDFVNKADRDWLLRKTAESVYFFDE